jgi:hypothetical protein
MVVTFDDAYLSVLEVGADLDRPGCRDRETS